MGGSGEDKKSCGYKMGSDGCQFSSLFAAINGARASPFPFLLPFAQTTFPGHQSRARTRVIVAKILAVGALYPGEAIVFPEREKSGFDATDEAVPS